MTHHRLRYLHRLMERNRLRSYEHALARAVEQLCTEAEMSRSEAQRLILTHWAKSDYDAMRKRAAIGGAES